MTIGTASDWECKEVTDREITVRKVGQFDRDSSWFDDESSRETATLYDETNGEIPDPLDNDTTPDPDPFTTLRSNGDDERAATAGQVFDRPVTPDPHPFAHLGPAPYRFIGVETTSDRQQVNAQLAAAGEVHTTSLCAGSCDHCGTGIYNAYFFLAADGTKFKVGSTCAEKAFAKPGHCHSRAASQFDRARRRVAKAKRQARLTEAENWITTNRDALAALPHPQSFRAERGETMIDCLNWYWNNAGTSGKLKIYRQAKKALK